MPLPWAKSCGSIRQKQALYGNNSVNRQTGARKNQAKYVIEILDDCPVVTAEQLKFWYWMSDYYMCTLGEVMNAACRRHEAGQ